MTTHDLKTWPKWFQSVVTGEKPFDIRENDRYFAPGDKVVLREWDPETKTYTGRKHEATIARVWRNIPGLVSGVRRADVRGKLRCLPTGQSD